MLQVVDYRTFETGLLKRGGWALDGGCLGFRFAEDMSARGLNVLAVDPSPSLGPIAIERITFLRVALTGMPRPFVDLVESDNEQKAYTVAANGGMAVAARTIPDLMEEYAIGQFEIVKLNVEGAEYEILANWPGPIARQIAVSFHDFIPGRNPCDEPEDYYGPMLDHIGQWYRPVQHKRTNRNGKWNYWDSLFVLKHA